MEFEGPWALLMGNIPTDVFVRPWIKDRCEVNYGWEFYCKEEKEDAIKLVMDRSQGQFQSLRTMFCSNKSLQYIAENARF
ncbi:hypothetical protein R1sor_012855 [Riccia sorocarpa]|uniref:Uncharacterized protein n=1 Tax=Riccia sorocarpa TaxID=122646 RepID=A0ABD3IB45_9MARC